MKNAVPEWRLTIVSFVASVFATGAFWYFVAQKSLTGMVVSAVATVALVLGAIRISIINDRLKAEITGMYGLPGLKERVVQLADTIDSLSAARRSSRSKIERRGPQDQELYRFDLATTREFEQKFWHETVLLRDRIAKEFALGDPRLNSAPQSLHAISELVAGLRAVAAQMQ